jgi:hypothetical protein
MGLEIIDYFENINLIYIWVLNSFYYTFNEFMLIRILKLNFNIHHFKWPIPNILVHVYRPTNKWPLSDPQSNR